MSNLYATITSDARKTNPTSRAHYEVTATAQSYTGSVGVNARRDRYAPLDPATFALCVDPSGSTAHPDEVTRPYPAEVWHAAAPAIEAALRAAVEAGGVCETAHTLTDAHDPTRTQVYDSYNIIE